MYKSLYVYKFDCTYIKKKGVNNKGNILVTTEKYASVNSVISSFIY